mmetsp:Transcript_24952/g.28423  ORF Transcript_24952/g.28423 Transcript_24952/m.28423 type:complete len:105 (+) Transcript_24952:847-1161(+)
MCSTATKTTRLSNDDDNVNRHNNKEREQHRQCHLRLMQLCEYSNNNNNTTDTTTRYKNQEPRQRDYNNEHNQQCYQHLLLTPFRPCLGFLELSPSFLPVNGQSD